MDPCAELTLRIVRAAQEALAPRSSAVDWLLLPEHRRATWPETRELLAAAPKPLIVAPLVEPGWLAFWSAAVLAPADRELLNREFANQREYFAEKLGAIRLNEDGCVETPDGEFDVPVAAFRRWTDEYTVAAGIGMSRSSKPNRARVLIRLPGGGGPPVGWFDPAAS